MGRVVLATPLDLAVGEPADNAVCGPALGSGSSRSTHRALARGRWIEAEFDMSRGFPTTSHKTKSEALGALRLVSMLQKDRLASDPC